MAAAWSKRQLVGNSVPVWAAVLTAAFFLGCSPPVDGPGPQTPEPEPGAGSREPSGPPRPNGSPDAGRPMPPPNGGDEGQGPDAAGPMSPPSASSITLEALPANGTVGLDWTRDPGAESYRIYWSTSPEVSPEDGQRLESPEPAFVHRGLENGTSYHYVVTAISAAGESGPSNRVTATPGGEWALEALGPGDFDDVATGARVPRLPLARRMHVLLLPVGYLANEMDVFHDHARHDLEEPSNDVDRWIKEVFAVEPYSRLREAFVIWYLPRASQAHIGEGPTAFGDDDDTAAAPLWAALDEAGEDAFAFPPKAASRNHAASFLLFDPARGRAGVSGHSTTCRHPDDRSLSLRCAFGIGHAHEFTHAFSDVRDEYLEDNTTRTEMGALWSNVTGTNRCDELPWAHLLHGRGINDRSAELVGAFGRPQRGYHSELKCLMNGSHENGVYYCGSGTLTLRPARLCNFCRELTTFRLLYRTGILEGSTSEAFATWKGAYRGPFFQRFGFQVPSPVPQTIRCSGEAEKPVYEACVP